ncbi:PEPxxWA-CTERM sorting domain-containing protein [Erythrobacter sp. SD-21]|uniref:PEPxxWA-CTERM sorting domain-containing protein n=1 Tax=Erythrobacter sp. SD-21 TaxID=161528 RepID=UPI0018DDDA90|nr:PEPxxWA-CTERM sorting domain-containing protein [Erythrobacter sp. SD-21]
MTIKALLISLIALLFALPAQAATIVATGTYGEGESVLIDVVPETMFGSGTYRFRFQSSSPLTNLIGNAITLETVSECIDGEPCLTYTYERRYRDIAQDSSFSFVVDVPPSRIETFDPDALGNPGATFTYTEICCAFSLFQSNGATASTSGTWTISAVSVPEPGAWALMIFGFLLVGGVMRRKTGFAQVA